MRVRVRPLRQQGRRASQYGSMASGIVGDLLTHTMAESGKDSYRVATLRAGLPKDPDLLPPLYEPVLVTVGPNGFLLRGFESVDGASSVQEWHCEVAT